jgi:hypothetical protein
MSSSSGGTRAAGGPLDGEVVDPDPGGGVGSPVAGVEAPFVAGAPVVGTLGGALVEPELPDPEASGTVEDADLFNSQGADTRLDPEVFPLELDEPDEPSVGELAPGAELLPPDVVTPVEAPGTGWLVPVVGVCVVEPVGTDGGVLVELGVAVSGPISSATSRNLSCAVAWSDRSSSGSGLPGISTTMMFPPCVLTSDSAMPAPLTRAEMMSAASLSLSFATVAPFDPAACKTIRWPPWRSRPSFGFQFPMAAAPTYIAAMTSAKMSSVRPGWEVRVATSDSSSVGLAV